MQSRIGVIDLGSNTTRLIIVGYTAHHSFKLLDEVRESVRLAEGMGDDGRLQPAPMARATATMQLYKRLCSTVGVEKVVPVATSAVREASNQREFLERIEKEAGLQFRVLSAEQEAYYGYLGVVNTLNLSDAFIIDIGGGSTQVSLMRGRQMIRFFSQPIGALRLSDRYVKSDPISNKDFKALERAASERFTDLKWLKKAEAPHLAGLGGTIRTLADIDQKLRGYPLSLTNAYVFTRERLETLIEELRGMTLTQRENVPGLNSDRADIILAGAVILNTVMKQGGFEQIMVSGQGVREGLFYEHFLIGETPPLFTDLRGFSVQNTARIYGYESLHAAKVRELALSMFDQMTALHGYGAWEREILGYASTLHDIGLAIGYYDHHRHGAYLITNTALLGFSHREIAMLALLVRFHRKGQVSPGEYEILMEPGDLERIMRLSALLRLSEFLERRKSQVVQSLKVELGDTIRITAQTVGDADVEIWDANRSSGLFQKAFGRNVQIRQG